MSVTEDDGEPTSLGSQVAPHLQRLPIGEPNPLMRLHQVAYDTQAHKDSGRAVGARSLADIAGFAPTTLHALGVRTSTEVVRKQHDLVITNVPGPQVPLFAAGAQLVASYPVLPLSAGHMLAIGVTSYDGEVFFGLTADRDAISDLDVLAQCLLDALEELLDTTVRTTDARQPTRKAPAAARRAAAKKAAARQEAARKAAGQKRAAVRNLVSRAAELGTGAAAPPTATGPAKADKSRVSSEACSPSEARCQEALAAAERLLPSERPMPSKSRRTVHRARRSIDVSDGLRSDDLGRGGRSAIGYCERLAYPGCAATPSLVASMEADTLIEEAEYAALSYAGVLSLVLKPGWPRLVVAAEVQPDQLTDLGGPLGEVEVRGLTWHQVRALFADEPAAIDSDEAGKRGRSRAEPGGRTRCTRGRSSTR